MKLQLQGQTLRFRIDEAELAALLEGEEVVNRTSLPGSATFVQSLTLIERGEAALACMPGHWRLHLPRTEVEAYTTRLPCREGLEFQLEQLQLTFEVDVRDSVRKRRGVD